MSDVTRRELMKRAAAAGLCVALAPGTGVPDLTAAEAATLGDGRIGARIRAYRKRLGLSQEVVAHRLGESRRWLQKVWRDVQRFVATVADDGRTIRGAWETSDDGSTWRRDFEPIYTRVK